MSSIFQFSRKFLKMAIHRLTWLKFSESELSINEQTFGGGRNLLTNFKKFSKISRDFQSKTRSESIIWYYGPVMYIERII